MNSPETRARRTFLTGLASAAGGLLLSTREAAGQQTGVFLGVSPADSLSLYIDLLRKVQLEILQERADVWSAATSRVTALIQTITRTIGELERELSTIGDASSAAQLKLLSASGQSTLNAIRQHSQSAADLAAPYIAAVSEFATVSESRPTVVMSRRGFDLLQTLIGQLRQVEQLQAEAQRFASEYHRASDEAELVVRKIQEFMTNAATAVAELTEPDPRPTRSGLKEEAIRQVESAKQALLSLKTLTKAPLVRTLALAELLEGTKLWIQRLSPTTTQAGLAQGPIVLASYQAQVNDVERKRLRDLLNQHCPAGTPLKAMWVIALAGPIWILHSAPQQRTPLLRVSMDLLPCQDSAHMNGLIDALANFGNA